MVEQPHQRVHLIDLELRAHGHRLTPRRLMVVEILAEQGGHITGEEILDRVRSQHPSTNKTTVYRTLELLSTLGVVAVTDLGSGKLEYEIVGHPHHHLICEQCELRVEVDDDLLEPLRTGLLQRYGFTASLDHFAMFGVCPECRVEA